MEATPSGNSNDFFMPRSLGESGVCDTEYEDQQIKNEMDDTHKVIKPKAKRNRIPVSCTLCRKRKSKCDRARPYCGTCIGNGNSHLCQYEEQPQRTRRRSRKTPKVQKPHIESTQQTVRYSSASIPPLNAFYNPAAETTVNTRLNTENIVSTGLLNNTVYKPLNSLADSENRVFSYPILEASDAPVTPRDEAINHIRLAPISSNSSHVSSGSKSTFKLPSLDSLSSKLQNNQDLASSISKSQFKSNPDNDVLRLVEKLKASDELSMENLRKESYSAKYSSRQNSEDSMQEMRIPPSNLSSGYAKNNSTVEPQAKDAVDGLLLGKTDTEDLFPRSLKQSDSNGNMLSRNDGIARTPNGSTVSMLAAVGTGTNIQEQGIFKTLKILPTDTLNFNDGYSPLLYNFARISNFGPLSSLSSILKDPMIRLIRDQVIKHKKESLFAAANDAEVQHRDRFTHYLGIDDIAPFDATGKTKLTHNMNGSKPLSYGNRPAACPFSTVDLAIKHILGVLPVKRVIWLSIKRFFSNVYPFVPYLDEVSFITNIEAMLESDHLKDINSEEKVTKLNIKKKLDFAVVGILLIVLKFVHESVLVNGDDLKHPEVDYTEDELYLLDNPVNEKVDQVAQMCLGQFKLFARCALPVFQLALLLKEYEAINGCSDNTSADSQIYVSMLVQIAQSIGLNRDPCHFDEIISMGKVGNLWRKIWYGLIAMDLKQCILHGDPKIMNFDSFDTKLPTFDEASSNIKDFELEKIVIAKMRQNYRLQRLMLDLEEYVSRLNHVSNVQLIMKKMWNLENHMLDNLGTFREVMEMPIDNKVQQIDKMWNIMIYFQGIGLIECICHNLYLHYQKTHNSSACLYFAEKGLVAWLQVFSNFEIFTNECPLYFGLGHDLAIIQWLMPLLYRGWINLMSLHIGCLLLIQKYGTTDEQPKKVQIFKKVCELISSVGNWYLPCLKTCSRRHFYAWKLLKAHTFVIYLTRKERVLFKSLLPLNNYLEQISVSDSLGLLELCDFNNYKVGATESEGFKELKNRLDHRKVQSPTEKVTPDSIDLNSLDLKTQDSGTTDINFEAIFPVEDWTKPMQEDLFWRNIFLQRENADSANAMQMQQSEVGTNINSPFGFTNGFHMGPESGMETVMTPSLLTSGDYISPQHMSVRGVDLYGVTPNVDTNNPPSADRFVDKTIYDMFS